MPLFLGHFLHSVLQGARATNCLTLAKQFYY
jgi:hypothetical protein